MVSTFPQVGGRAKAFPAERPGSHAGPAKANLAEPDLAPELGLRSVQSDARHTAKLSAHETRRAVY